MCKLHSSRKGKLNFISPKRKQSRCFRRRRTPWRSCRCGGHCCHWGRRRCCRWGRRRCCCRSRRCCCCSRTRARPSPPSISRASLDGRAGERAGTRERGKIEREPRQLHRSDERDGCKMMALKIKREVGSRSQRRTKGL